MIFYCQACKLNARATVNAGLDPITNNAVQHRCVQCDRPVGYIVYSPKELGVEQ